VLGVVWLVSMVVGAPTQGESLLCEVGGSCGTVDAKWTLTFAGGLAGFFAVVLVLVAGAMAESPPERPLVRVAQRRTGRLREATGLGWPVSSDSPQCL
jgi:type IV secretory pathway VirB2 component (pilin)